MESVIYCEVGCGVVVRRGFPGRGFSVVRSKRGLFVILAICEENIIPVGQNRGHN